MPATNTSLSSAPTLIVGSHWHGPRTAHSLRWPACLCIANDGDYHLLAAASVSSRRWREADKTEPCRSSQYVKQLVGHCCCIQVPGRSTCRVKRYSPEFSPSQLNHIRITKRRLEINSVENPFSIMHNKGIFR